MYSGQPCTAPKRIFIHRSIYGEFLERFVERTAKLVGEPYCHPVPACAFGKFGKVALNRTRSDSWKGAFVVKAVGGYGYSGWIWETVDGMFRIKQGPKLPSIETSEPGTGNRSHA